MGRGQGGGVSCCVGGESRGDGRNAELEGVGRGSDDDRGGNLRETAKIK